MIRRWIHPRSRELNRFADRELEGEERQRVASHLAGCARCRETVRFIRSVSEAADELSVPAARPELLDRVLSRRAAGDRVILPVATPPHMPSGLRRVGPYAAAVTLFIVAAALVTAATLRADRSALEFKPSAPRAGAEITAEYRGALFADEERLRLRAEFRYADGRIERRTAGNLVKGRGGVRQATFRLPDSVVYALFAVEDVEARRVDSNQGRLWDLLVHEADGRPAFRGLTAKMDDLVRRDWEAGHRTAAEMVEWYPDNVEGWDRLLMFERHKGLEEHVERFKAFEERFHNKARVTADEIVALYRYAHSVGDAVAADYWRDRLANEAPNHPNSVQIHAGYLAWELRDDPRSLLASLEELWQRFGPAHRELATIGYHAAVQARDPDAIGTWAPRYAESSPGERLNTAKVLLDYPELHNEGLGWLRQELERLQTPDSPSRLLGESVALFEFWRGRQVRTTLATLGQGLIAEGEIEAGIDSLSTAMQGGWDAALFRAAAETYLVLGDTVGALPIFASVFADPETPPAFADTVRFRVGRYFDETDWTSRVEHAREKMRQHYLTHADLRYLPGEIRVVDTDGAVRDLHTLVNGRATVVAFWSRAARPAMADLPSLRHLMMEVERDGAGVIVITDESPSSGFTTALAELGIDFPIYHDTEDTAKRAFALSAWPVYYVVDSRARVRFVNWTLADVRQQVTALVLTEALPTLVN